MEKLTNISEITGLPMVAALQESCGEDSCADVCAEYCDIECVGCPIQAAISRLHEYQDTGLEPSEIAEKLITAENTISELKAQLEMYRGFDGCRLNKLIDADMNGRLVVLPCKVGDTVYWKSNGKIKECKVHRFQQNKRGKYIVLKSNVVHGAFSVGLFGIQLFLIREDAEAALQKEGGEMSDVEKAITEFNSLIKYISDAYREDKTKPKEGDWNVQDACRLAIAALREKAERESPKPLTLDELRECCKNGEAVYVGREDKSPLFRGKSYCAAVLDIIPAFGSPIMHLQAIYGRNLTLAEDDYGKTWLAYRHMPKEAQP